MGGLLIYRGRASALAHHTLWTPVIQKSCFANVMTRNRHDVVCNHVTGYWHLVRVLGSFRRGNRRVCRDDRRRSGLAAVCLTGALMKLAAPPIDEDVKLETMAWTNVMPLWSVPFVIRCFVTCYWIRLGSLATWVDFKMAFKVIGNGTVQQATCLFASALYCIRLYSPFMHGRSKMIIIIIK